MSQAIEYVDLTVALWINNIRAKYQFRIMIQIHNFELHSGGMISTKCYM